MKHNKTIFKFFLAVALFFLVFEVFVFLVNQKNTFLNLVGVMFAISGGIVVFNILYNMFYIPVVETTNNEEKEEIKNEAA